MNQATKYDAMLSIIGLACVAVKYASANLSFFLSFFIILTSKFESSVLIEIVCISCISFFTSDLLSSFIAKHLKDRAQK